MKLLDILLFPRSLYQKLTDRRATLYFGIIFVGIMDIAFVLSENYQRFFAEKAQGELYYNILLVLISVIVLGIADVLFLSIPLYDLFKLFKKEDKPAGSGNVLVKLMKVYILAHFIILPIEIFIYAASRNVNDLNSGIGYLVALLAVILPFWFSAAIARGVNTIYNFSPLYKRLVFIVVLVWTYLLGSVFFFIIRNWIIMLLR